MPRNKSDALFKRCADKGGVIGVSLFAPGLAAGNEATVKDVVDAIAYMIDLVGEDHVAIGTDFSLNRPRPGPWQEWANRDKGSARVLTGFATAKISKPEGIRRIDEFPNLTAEMVARGWPAARVKGAWCARLAQAELRGAGGAGQGGARRQLAAPVGRGLARSIVRAGYGTWTSK